MTATAVWTPFAVSAGRPCRSGPASTRAGPTSRSTPSTPRWSNCCCSTGTMRSNPSRSSSSPPTATARSTSGMRRVHGLPAGSHYAYRVHGPWDPSSGLRYNGEKVLIDPYARGHRRLWARGAACAPGDNVAASMRRLVDTVDYDWEGDPPLAVRAARRHLRAARRRIHPLRSSGVQHPGTFAGVVEKIAYLSTRDHGRGTAAGLRLRRQRVLRTIRRRQRLRTTGDTTRSPGSRPPRPSARRAGQQFASSMVEGAARRHRGILDVVFNHTAEGNDTARPSRFRAGQPVYYMLSQQDPSRT